MFADLLKDDSRFSSSLFAESKGIIKVKDVRLAMTIHLSGRAQSYGFEMWNVYPNQLIQYHQLGCGDEERAASQEMG